MAIPEAEGMLGSGISDITLTPPCTPIPAYHPTFILVMRVCVTFVSILSIIGSVFIIGTFLAFKTLRTRARQILVQLSIADFAVAASHLVGVNVNLPKFAWRICSHHIETDINITTDALCKVQGGISIFFTIGSFFWTIAVALYLLTVIVFESQRVGRWLTYLFYPVCWGIPAVLVTVFALKDYLGFHANVDTGWCYLQNSVNGNGTEHGSTISEIFSQVFVYLTYFTLLLLYFWIRCSIRLKIRRVSNKKTVSYKLRLKAKNVDFKLTFIPIIFIFLRIWGTVLGIAYFYLPVSIRGKFRETKINAALVLMSAIGSSAQGLTNALLFCVFTSVVRRKLSQVIKHYVCCRKKDGAQTYLLEPSTNLSVSSKAGVENTTQYEEDEDVWKNNPSINCASRSKQVLGGSTVEGGPTCRLFSDSFEGSKYHSVSVGKRVTNGAE